MAFQFQYQAIAEPVPQAVGAPERTQLDKWYVEQEPPPRASRRELYAHGDSQLAGVGVVVLERTQPDKWQPQSADPPRSLKKIPYQLGESGALAGVGVFTTETVSLDRWEPVQNDPVRNRTRPPTWLGDSELGGVGVVTQETVSLDRFFLQASEPPRTVKHLPYPLGESGALAGVGVIVLETITRDRWGPQYPDYLAPLKRIASVGLGVDNFWQAVAPVVSLTTADRWAVAPDLPLRNRARTWLGDSELGGVGLFTVETITQDKWAASYPDYLTPLKRIAAPAVGADNFWQAVAPIPGVTTADRWIVQPDLPLRNRSKFPSWLGDSQLTLGVFTTETVSLDRFFIQASEPPRQVRHLPYPLGESGALGGLGVFSTEVVSADRWYTQQSEPPRALKHFPYPLGESGALVGQGVFTTEAISLDKWFQEPADVARPLRRSLYGLGDAEITLGVFTVETAALDRWYTQASEPARALKRVPYSLGESGAFVSVVVVISSGKTPITLLLRSGDLDMAVKNQALTVEYVAWNTSTNAFVTGDAANHTLRGVGDGVEFTPAATPVEVDATNLKGTYRVALAKGEANYNSLLVGGISSTANVVIIPVYITLTPDPLLAVVPGTYAGGTAGAAIGKVSSGQITVVSPVAQNGNVSIIQGDTYRAASPTSRALTWTDAAGTWPSLTGATAYTVTVYFGTTTTAYTGVLLTVGVANQVVELELTAAQTAAMPTGGFRFKGTATLSNGDSATLVDGTWSVALN